MTTANKITIFRILLIPFFVFEVLEYSTTGRDAHLGWAILSFAVAAICDGVDGYIARRYNQRSELGAVLDPLADKLLLVSAIVVLSFEHPNLATIPLWLTVTVIGRDVLLVIGMTVIHLMVGKVKVRPRVLGKFATVMQMVLVLWILLKWNDRWVGIWSAAAGLFTGVSGLLYVWDGTRQLSAHPSSSAKSEGQDS